MTYEEAKDKAMLYSIDSSLTCTCDEVHECQQCVEAYEEGKRIRLQNLEESMNNIDDYDIFDGCYESSCM